MPLAVGASVESSTSMSLRPDDKGRELDLSQLEVLTNDDQRWMQERADYWRKRFGLHEWKVTVGFDSELDTPRMEVIRQPEYLTADINVWPYLPKDDLDDAICHEIAHIFLADYDHWCGEAWKHMPKGESYRMNCWWQLIMERTAERLARVVREATA